MRHPDAQRALAILAGAPGIHLAVSVDHVNAGKEPDEQPQASLKKP
jgi:hypothetical protein